MHVRFRDMDNADGLREQIERMVGFATDRFAGRLIEVQVVVADVNGPRGGTDKRCSICGVLEGGKSVTVEEQGADATAVVSRAVPALGQFHQTSFGTSPPGSPSGYEAGAIGKTGLMLDQSSWSASPASQSQSGSPIEGPDWAHDGSLCLGRGGDAPRPWRS